MTSRRRRRVRPVRIHLPPADLMPAVVRGVGFRSECVCGWESRKRSSYAQARADLRVHRVECIRGPG